MHRIKDVMLAKGVKAVQLAEIMGKSKQYISNVVNHRTQCSLATLQEFASALNCTVAELIADYPTDIFCCPHCGKSIKIEEQK